MSFTAQTNQSPTMVNVDADARIDTSETDVAETLVRAEEAVRLALAPAVGPRGSGPGGQVAQTETPIPLARPSGNLGSPAPVLRFPPPSPPRPMATLHALQEWEGYVVEIAGDTLDARLVDLTVGSTHEEEEAVIPLAELSEQDLGTVRVGSIFRWVIGYERSPAGTKKRVSQIVFRDLPRMTERDFQEGRNWARETMRAFDR